MDSELELHSHEEVETIFEAVSLESSEDHPMEEWSSFDLFCEIKKPKEFLKGEGLYDPGTPDICTKYIAMSASSTNRPRYYNYPLITDPGITQALLEPEDLITYSDDGQDLYLAICNEMGQTVARCFHRGLLCDKIDLSYYGVNPYGVRAMALALMNNTFVKNINLTDNMLNADACYHLSEMLATNTSLVELNLSGCRIGSDGVRLLLARIVENKSLKILNLTRNDIGDEGMVYFANAVREGLDVTQINLSHNDISGKGVFLLVEPFDTYNKITHWDLSYNNLCTQGTYSFLMALAGTSNLVKNIDLSWNSLSGLRIGQALKHLLTIRDMQHLNLSHNKLQSEAIAEICTGLRIAKKLMSMNLSYNPLTPTDALLVLKKIKSPKVRVTSMIMESVTVDKNFILALDEVKRKKPDLNITFGYVNGIFKAEGPDKRETLFNRLQYFCRKPKKKMKKIDIALVLLQLQKDKVTVMSHKDFGDLLSKAGVPVSNDLLTEVANIFPGPRPPRGVLLISIDAMAEYSKRKYPDRQLPPTPPPEPEPEPTPLPKIQRQKTKKKSKKKKR